MRVIAQTILYLLAFAFLFFIFMVIVNSSVFDEELIPEVQAIKNIEAKKISRSNAYPALMAINGPVGKPLKEDAETIRNVLNTNVVEKGIDHLTEQQYSDLIGTNSQIQWPIEMCHSGDKPECMEEMILQFNDNSELNEDMMAQLSRYEELLEYKAFGEATQLNLTSPNMGYGAGLRAKRVYLAHQFNQQNSREFIATVEKDMRFWRMVLKDSHLLITKMVAISTLRDNLGALSAAIRKNHFNIDELSDLQSQIKVLSESETDMINTFKFEFKYAMSMIDTEEFVNSTDWYSLINFYQHQATLNTYYNYAIKPMIQTAKLSSKEFYQFVNSDAQHMETPVSRSPAMIYNPTGKMLVGFAVPAYNDYTARMHDLNGMFNLFKLQIEIAANPDQDRQEIIQQSSYTNPYTDLPMQYDTENQRIYFKCLDRSSKCEVIL